MKRRPNQQRAREAHRPLRVFGFVWHGDANGDQRKRRWCSACRRRVNSVWGLWDRYLRTRVALCHDCAQKLPPFRSQRKARAVAVALGVMTRRRRD